MSDTALSDVLRQGARVVCDAADYQRLAVVAARVETWHRFPELAEAHGLAPLMSDHLTAARVTLPDATRRQLFALATRHRHANRVRFLVLGEILDAFDSAAIPVLVLKGAALAHVLYPSAGLRPISDIDLLVDPRLAARAQSVLGTLGFDAPLSPTSPSLTAHHHLPAATKLCDGHLVMVEIHRDALTRDSSCSLSMDRLTSAPQAFSLDGRTAWTLGHADMLYQLCRHMAGRASLFRLIWMADVVGYAMRYRREVSWTEVRERYPFVLNALSLLHLVRALPPELLEHVTPADGDGLRGVGVACKPLAEIISRVRPVRDIGHDLLDPSDWWLRLYYGLDDQASLRWTRWVRHPLQVGRWLARRGAKSVHWWARTILVNKHV